MSSPAMLRATAPQVERSHAATTVAASGARSVFPIIVMLGGLLVIAGALVFLLVDREPEVEILDFSTAFACPPGVEARSARMQVTAQVLNVRAAASSKADRLPDRTLRKSAAVTEECRAGGWSRVRLVDGRSGWVANQYLKPITKKS